MTAIIIPRRHYSQPQGRVVVNHASPLAAGAAVLYRGGGRANDVTGDIAVVATGATERPSRDGVALHTNKAGYASVPLRNIGTAPCVMFWVGTLGEYGRGGSEVEGGGLISHEFRPAITWGDRSNNRIFCYHDSWGSLLNGGSMDVGDFVSLVVVRTATNIRMYKNGVLTAQFTQVAREYAPSKPVSINSADTSPSNWSADCATNLAGIILGSWSADDVAEFTTNPWQLFRADPIRIYSLPSGPVGISWSSLTASNITQTGARLTLGGITR